MKHKTIVQRVEQGDLSPVFSLRSLTAADDAAYMEDLIAATDGMFEANVNALAKWAVPYPADKPECEDPLDSEEKVREFFADPDTDHEWIAAQAIYAHRQMHKPTSTFI